MATVVKTKSRVGTIAYRAIWFIRDSEGNRKQQSKSFPDAKSAKAHASRMEQQVERPGVGDPNNFTLDRFLEHWISIREAAGELGDSSAEVYGSYCKQLSPRIGHIKLAKLTPLDLDGCWANMLSTGLSRRYVANVGRMLRAALKQARRWKLILISPADDSTLPSLPTEPVRALHDEEVRRLVPIIREAEANGKAFPGLLLMTQILLETGIRRSELLGLCFDAVDVDNAAITICRAVVLGKKKVPFLRESTKTTTSQRTIAVSSALIAAIGQHEAFVKRQMLIAGPSWRRDLPLLVFPVADGGPMDPGTASGKMKQLLRLAGVTLAPKKGKRLQPMHGFRHAQATNLLGASVDLKTVSNRLGHASAATTLRIYAHSTPERDRSASDLMSAHFAKLAGGTEAKQPAADDDAMQH